MLLIFPLCHGSVCLVGPHAMPSSLLIGDLAVTSLSGRRLRHHSYTRYGRTTTGSAIAPPPDSAAPPSRTTTRASWSRPAHAKGSHLTCAPRGSGATSASLCSEPSPMRERYWKQRHNLCHHGRVPPLPLLERCREQHRVLRLSS